jgi:hypothetical protein
VLGDHADEVPLGVAGQGGFAEMRVLREEIAGLGVHVGEIAAATAGHQDFLAGLVGVVEQQHLRPRPAAVSAHINPAAPAPMITTSVERKTVSSQISPQNHCGASFAMEAAT